MKVELLVPRVGPAGAFNRGDVIEVDEAEAKRMIEANQAIPHAKKAKPETRKRTNVGKGKG